MREVKTHEINGLNESIVIQVWDGPGPGNACHDYRLCLRQPGGGLLESARIRFQNGPIVEAGANGLSNEALLAVVIDRLQGFQSGKFACRENALALTKIEEALHWLLHRTSQRLKRGVEGTLTP